MTKHWIVFALLAATFALSACSSESDYQRPRSTDQPQIYANKPPVGNMRWD